MRKFQRTNIEGGPKAVESRQCSKVNMDLRGEFIRNFKSVSYKCMSHNIRKMACLCVCLPGQQMLVCGYLS